MRIGESDRCLPYTSTGMPECEIVRCDTGPRHASKAAGYPRIFNARKTTSKPRRRTTAIAKSNRPGSSLRSVIRIDAYVAFREIAGPNASRSGTRVEHHANLNFLLRQFLTRLLARCIRYRHATDIDADVVRIPDAPLASTTTMSLVDVSPSTEIELKDCSTAYSSASCNSRCDISASVMMNDSMVAMSG